MIILPSEIIKEKFESWWEKNKNIPYGSQKALAAHAFICAWRISLEEIENSLMKLSKMRADTFNRLDNSKNIIE